MWTINFSFIFKHIRPNISNITTFVGGGAARGVITDGGFIVGSAAAVAHLVVVTIGDLVYVGGAVATLFQSSGTAFTYHLLG